MNDNIRVHKIKSQYICTQNICVHKIKSEYICTQNYESQVFMEENKYDFVKKNLKSVLLCFGVGKSEYMYTKL